MICNITSDSNSFDYFLEEALVKKSVEPVDATLPKIKSFAIFDFRQVTTSKNESDGMK